MPPFEVHFGGPDRPRGCLRDLLAEQVEAVPPGGSIDWATYYFRDRRLAGALVRAHERGVAVRVTLEGRPRTPAANDSVGALLGEGLGDGLRLVTRTGIVSHRLFLPPRLHEKLYCFSHPQPVAFIGSFNPSGDDPELAPAIVAEIGDQDRGHNLLVALRSPKLFAGLVEHARRLHANRHSFLDRFRPAANRDLSDEGMAIHFLPSVRESPAVRLIRRCGAGHRVRIAASHLSGPTSLRTLRDLARRGASVEILAEATQRRVPQKTAEQLRAAGVELLRAVDPEGLPMHAKFALIDGHNQRRVIFGSFNWSERSRRLNREIGAITSDPKLYDAFAERWDVLQKAFGGAG